MNLIIQYEIFLMVTRLMKKLWKWLCCHIGVVFCVCYIVNVIATNNFVMDVIIMILIMVDNIIIIIVIIIIIIVIAIVIVIVIIIVLFELFLMLLNLE